MVELLESSAERVVLLSGPVASGKTTLSRLLADRFGFCIVSTRELLGEGPQDRLSLQAAGASRDDGSAGRWVRDGLVQLQGQWSDEIYFVVDSVRTLDQIRWVRKTFGASVEHVHLTAHLDVLAGRYSSRSEGFEYAEIRNDPVERSVGVLVSYADLVIHTGGLGPESVLGLVADHLGLTSDTPFLAGS